MSRAKLSAPRVRFASANRRAARVQFTGQGEVHECIDHYLDRWGEAYYQELQQFVNEVQAGEQTQSATAADCTGDVKLAEMILEAYEEQLDK